MENNANHTWEPEETKISSMPAYEQQEPADDDDSDYEMFSEDDNADSGFKNSIRRSL